MVGIADGGYEVVVIGHIQRVPDAAVNHDVFSERDALQFGGNVSRVDADRRRGQNRYDVEKQRLRNGARCESRWISDCTDVNGTVEVDLVETLERGHRIIPEPLSIPFVHHELVIVHSENVAGGTV